MIDERVEAWLASTLRMAHERETDAPLESIALSLQVIATTLLLRENW